MRLYPRRADQRGEPGRRRRLRPSPERRRQTRTGLHDNELGGESMHERARLRRAAAALLALACALTACGGSDDGPGGRGSHDEGGEPSVASGVYRGTIASNESYDTLMVVALEDGKF